MEQGDIVLLVFGSIVTLALWGRWYKQSFLPGPRGSPDLSRVWLQAVPPFCLVLLYFVLRKFAAHDVRDALPEVCCYMFLGAIWLALVERATIYLGLSARDDVFERNNRAAAAAISGLLLGANLGFAGANVGEGPGWPCVLFCAALATSGLFFAWWALSAATGLADAISVDRDLASGLRAAGFFVACGLIFGQAVAGDWSSTAATVKDFFKFGWPAAILWLVAYLFEWRLSPSPTRPKRPGMAAGLLPALLYLGLAIVVVWFGWQR